MAAELQARIKAEREEAAKALAVAQRVREQLAGQDSWPEEKQSEFDAALADFHKHNAEADRLAAQAEKLADLDAARERYEKPQSRVTHSSAAPSERETEEAARAHRDAFLRYLKHDTHGLSPEERNALVSTNQTLGGFLVPGDFQAEVIRAEAGFAQVRAAGARVVPTMSDPLIFPKVVAGTDPYSSGVSGSWRNDGYITGGTAPTVQNQPTFGQERIPIHIWQPDAIEITQKLIMDSAVPLDSLIAELLGETKGLDEDTAFLNGTGVTQPLGILATASIGTVASGTAASLTYDGIVDMYTTLPAQYRGRASWMMNSGSHGVLLKLSETTNRPLFPLNQPITQLFGRPIFFSEFMPDVAASALPIIFGDFSRFVIAERAEFRIQRLVERYAPNVGILATAMLGGQVVQPLGFKIQVVSA